MAPAPLVTAALNVADSQRRILLISRLAAGLCGLMSLYVLLIQVVFNRQTDLFLLNQLVAAVFYGLLAWTTRQGYVRSAGSLLTASALVIVVMLSVRGGGVTAVGPVMLFVVIGLGCAVLSWRGMVLLGIVSMVTIGLLTLLNVQGLISGLTKPLPVLYYGIVYALLIGFVSVLGCLSTRSNERLLTHIAAQADAIVEQNTELTKQRELLHQQQAELEQHRTQLEQEVQSRTAALQTALDEVRRGAIALRELQSPIVPIADGVLVLPLVGAFDNARAQQFVQDILEGVELRRAHTVLLDVTGLPVMDTLAARTLLDAASAVQLLGARIILVGVTPAVAQTIVGLGIDLRGLKIERDLQSAVVHVLGGRAILS